MSIRIWVVRVNNRKFDYSRWKHINNKSCLRLNLSCWTRFAKKTKWSIVIKFSSMKKKFSIFFKIRNNEQNEHRNHFNHDQNFKNIVSQIYVSFIVRTKILSTKKLVFAIQRELFMNNSNSNYSRSKNNTRSSRKLFVLLSTKQRILFRKKRFKTSFRRISTSRNYRSNFVSF